MDENTIYWDSDIALQSCQVKITAKQLQMFYAIRNYWLQHSLPPTPKDVADMLGIHEHSARWRIAKLIEAGLITQDERRRSLRIKGTKIKIPNVQIETE